MSAEPVSVSSSTRACPRCRAHVANDQLRCACGSVIEPDSNHLPSSQGIVAQAEALYETYLNARLQRAVRALQTIKASLARDPASPTLIGQMRETTMEIESLRGQLSAQTVRTEDARRRVAITTEPPVAVAPTVSVEPDAVFRMSQAAAAEAVMDSLSVGRVIETRRIGEADLVFNATQAVRAERLVEPPRVEVRNCPKCRSATNADGKCIACGHALPGGAATEFISKEEIAALRKPFTSR
jgi:hypothetical protein